MSDLWLGFFIGYVIATILGVIVELICIKTGRSDINTWVEEDTPLEPPNEPIGED
jgi:hypothetical protein